MQLLNYSHTTTIINLEKSNYGTCGYKGVVAGHWTNT
jgi:hypothetical protein